jgi:CheY-like chemotaxis protein
MDGVAMAQKSVTVLLVSPFEEDQRCVDQILAGSGWRARAVWTGGEALVFLRTNAAAVVVRERDLPDGNWRDILDAPVLLAHPPSLVVTSRLADEYLWGDVLNPGGWDVLGKPLQEKRRSGRSIQLGGTGTASGQGPCGSGRQSPKRGSCPYLGLGEEGRRWRFTA